MKILLRLILLAIFVNVEFQFKSIGTKETCRLKDVLTIIKSNSDQIFHQIDNAGANVNQYCVDAKHKLELFSESETVSKILMVMQNTLGTFEDDDDCTKLAKIQFNILNNRTTTQYEECNNHTKNSKLFLENKIASTAKWVHSVKVMTGLVLQNCAMKNLYTTCSSLKGCSLEAIGGMTLKIIEFTKNNTDEIRAIVAKQNDCFEVVAKEALDVQQHVHEEIFKCNFREIENFHNEIIEVREPAETILNINTQEETTPDSSAVDEVQTQTLKPNHYQSLSGPTFQIPQKVQRDQEHGGKTSNEKDEPYEGSTEDIS